MGITKAELQEFFALADDYRLHARSVVRWEIIYETGRTKLAEQELELARQALAQAKKKCEQKQRELMLSAK